MPNQPKTPARAVRLSNETWTALRVLAARSGLSVSEVIRLALDDFIGRNN